MITNQSFSGTEINKDAVSYVSFLDETSELFTSYQNQWNAKNDIKLLILCSFLRQVPGQAIKHSSSALRGEGGSGPAADNALSSGSATGRLLCSS